VRKSRRREFGRPSRQTGPLCASFPFSFPNQRIFNYPIKLRAFARFIWFTWRRVQAANRLPAAKAWSWQAGTTHRVPRRASTHADMANRLGDNKRFSPAARKGGRRGPDSLNGSSCGMRAAGVPGRGCRESIRAVIPHFLRAEGGKNFLLGEKFFICRGLFFGFFGSEKTGDEIGTKGNVGRSRAQRRSARWPEHASAGPFAALSGSGSSPCMQREGACRGQTRSRGARQRVAIRCVETRCAAGQARHGFQYACTSCRVGVRAGSAHPA